MARGSRRRGMTRPQRRYHDRINSGDPPRVAEVFEEITGRPLTMPERPRDHSVWSAHAEMPPDEEIARLILECRGNMAAVCRAIGCARNTLRQYIEANPELLVVLGDARETILDEAEDVLAQRALAGETSELIFLLKTRGGSRGYTFRQEITGADGSPLMPANSSITVYLPSNGREGGDDDDGQEE